jgi:DNA-binding GntR family transcriptional regulator
MSVTGTRKKKTRSTRRPGRPVSNTPIEVSQVSRSTLNEEVYRQLQEAIMEGRITPGSTFTIRGLAESFGISPMPVREALRRLVAEHALQLLPNRSVTLPLMTREKFAEITRIRVSLEGLAAEIGAGRIDSAEVDRLQHLTEAMEAPGATRSPLYLSNNRNFHFTLYQSAAMPTLLSMIHSLWMQIGPILTMHAQLYDDSAEPHVEPHHREALAGLRDGDPTRVRVAIESDILSAAENIAEML